MILAEGASMTNGGIVLGGFGGYGDNKSGGAGGIGVSVDGGNLTNTGTIIGGAGGAGYYAGGNGGAGVYLNGGTLVTSGTIDGGAGSDSRHYYGAPGDSVQFGALAATLELQAGAAFYGVVAANGGVADGLMLTGAAAGTLTGLGTQFTGFATIGETASSTWVLTGGNALSHAETLSVAGTLTVSGSLSDAGSLSVAAGGKLQGGGTLSFLGAASNGGTIEAGGAVTFESSVSGQGVLQIGNAGTLALMGGDGTGQTADFLAAKGMLDLAAPLEVLGGIEGFRGSDQIDLLGVQETSYLYANHVLTVMNGAQTVASLTFAGAYKTANFHLASDGHTGTMISFVKN